MREIGRSSVGNCKVNFPLSSHLVARAKYTSSTANSEASLPDPKDKIQEQNLLHTAMMASDDNRPADARTCIPDP